MKVTISIVSHNQEKLVQSLLLSLDNNLVSGNIDFTIIIRNNLHSIYKYKSSKFKLIVINNLEPKGFGSNHNLNFSILKSDFFLVLNPDIIFHVNFNFNNYIKTVIANDLSISTPSIVDYNNKTLDHVRKCITLTDLIVRRLSKKNNHKHHWIAGMFMFFNSDTFFKLSGFNETFFMYVEDTDICLRCNGIIGILSNFAVQHIEQRNSFKSLKHFIWHLKSLLKYSQLYLFSNIYKKPPKSIYYIL